MTEGNAYIRKRRESKADPVQRMTIEDPRKWINLTLGVVMAITAVATAVTSCQQSQMMDAQTKQNQTIIDQMKKQTEQTDAVIKQMRLEQRAWLAVRQLGIVGNLVPGQRSHS